VHLPILIAGIELTLTHSVEQLSILALRSFFQLRSASLSGY
jgi:hypothetical protein